FILRKTKKEIEAVFAPKVSGVLHLDEASKNQALDFFILFSSGAGITGNAGQADYAMANAFLDRYSLYRNELVKSGQRHGKTCAINWPLGREGGMHVDEETEKMMRQRVGIVAMDTPSGMRAFYKSWAS